MKIDTEDFRVKQGKKVRLNKWPTKVRPLYSSEEDYRESLSSQTEQLSSLQQKHYASNRHALLLIFQAMDAAGKDGVIRHVMSGINPQGCQVFSFKHPSPIELDHDFLWRTTMCLPERGRIGVFNRSYYEDVLIVRVHPEILQSQLNLDRLPKGKSIWKQRYRSILEHERHLDRNGTRVVKFFLHISKEEQRQRFLARIDDPDKNWKFGEADMNERAYWGDYMSAYEHCLTATSTDHAPWYVVPADDKQNARLIVSQIVLEALRSLKPSYPGTSRERAKALQEIRKKLVSGSDHSYP
jgi:PPK2 family polyphosphate:nucleotide phosphotransferase